MILKEQNTTLHNHNIKNKIFENCYTMQIIFLAGWQSGHAAACKAVYSGSIPDSASSFNGI